MAFTTANPKRNHRRSHSIFDHLFNELTHSTKHGKPVAKRVSRPAVNIIEGKDDFKINLAIPGYSKEDVNISIEKDNLKVEAKKETEAKENEKFLRREFSLNEFKRTFELPETIDKTKVAANFKNGILTITLTKKEEAKELPPRTIEIQG